MFIFFVVFIFSCNSKIDSTVERRIKCWLPVETNFGIKYTLDEECMIGSQIPNFKRITITGEVYSNFTNKTKKVYNLWFMACPPCIAEIPGLNKLQKHFKDVEFVSICLDEKDDLIEFLGKNEFEFIHFSNGRDLIDSFFFETGYPITILTDFENKIVDVISGGRTDSLASDDIYNKVSTFLK